MTACDRSSFIKLVLALALISSQALPVAHAVNYCHQAWIAYEAAKADVNRWIRNHPGVDLAWAQKHHPHFRALNQRLNQAIAQRNYHCMGR